MVVVVDVVVIVVVVVVVVVVVHPAVSVPEQVPSVQVSSVVQAFPSLQALPPGRRASAGQNDVVPVHRSTTSQAEAAPRQIAVEGRRLSSGQDL